MAYANVVCGKKMRTKMGETMNEAAAAPVSTFARRYLEKMGWEEGKGLGKEGNGINTHVRIRRREDEMGLGHNQHVGEAYKDMWWASAINKTLANLSGSKSATTSSATTEKKKKKKEKRKRKDLEGGKKMKKEKKKRKREEEQVGEETSARTIIEGKDNGQPNESLDEILFRATGGARFGMRAGSSSKLMRTERLAHDKDMEEKARKMIEWNGLGNPQSNAVKRNQKQKESEVNIDSNGTKPKGNHDVNDKIEIQANNGKNDANTVLDSSTHPEENETKTISSPEKRKKDKKKSTSKSKTSEKKEKKKKGCK